MRLVSESAYRKVFTALSGEGGGEGERQENCGQKNENSNLSVHNVPVINPGFGSWVHQWHGIRVHRIQGCFSMFRSLASLGHHAISNPRHRAGAARKPFDIDAHALQPRDVETAQRVVLESRGSTAVHVNSWVI